MVSITYLTYSHDNVPEINLRSLRAAGWKSIDPPAWSSLRIKKIFPDPFNPPHLLGHALQELIDYARVRGKIWVSYAYELRSPPNRSHHVSGMYSLGLSRDDQDQAAIMMDIFTEQAFRESVAELSKILNPFICVMAIQSRAYKNYDRHRKIGGVSQQLIRDLGEIARFSEHLFNEVFSSLYGPF